LHSPRTGQHSSESISFDSLLDWSREIHASTMILLAWVGIPLLRFHPHPSHRRSIGQTIGPTACSPERAAIFMMPLLTRACPAYFGWEPYSSLRTFQPYLSLLSLPGLSHSALADPVCVRHLSCKGTLTPRPEVGSLRSPSYGHATILSIPSNSGQQLCGFAIEFKSDSIEDSSAHNHVLG